MQIEIRENCAYDLLVPTSIGLRLTPLGGQPVHCSDTFNLTATSAESNVASVSSYLGLPVKVLTKFVKDSPFARFIKDKAASGVEKRIGLTSDADVEQEAAEKSRRGCC